MRQIHATQAKPATVGTATVYDRIADLSDEVTRSRGAFTGLLAAAPYPVSPLLWARFKATHQALRDWQHTSLDLLRASVSRDAPTTIAKALLDHLPHAFGWIHHTGAALGSAAPPAFFRTDQAKDGTVLEVQCPGSLWGVHEILRETYVAEGERRAQLAAPLSTVFADALTRHLGNAPVIHHLLDNSSHPAGERFFIQRARRSVRYASYDPEVRAVDANFVRAHDFFTLLIDNFARRRLQRLEQGESLYDLPPVALFDQKLLLALPFDSETRGYYSDAVRGVFPYAAVVRPSGVELPDGSRATLRQFASLPRRDRSYFLKYAGTDVGRNWGSQAVFDLARLGRDACLATLESAIGPYEQGERWIVQRECGAKEHVSHITRDGELAEGQAHSKHSVFHGPYGPLGVLVMFERFYKVHGSTETVTTIGVEDPSA